MNKINEFQEFCKDFSYAITNENLKSIYYGLELNKKSFFKKTGLVINGSGDQGLAILSSNNIKKIFLADIDKRQFNVTSHKINLSKNKKYEEFRNVQIFGESDGCFQYKIKDKKLIQHQLNKRNAFFSNERLDIIRKNLHRLEFVLGDMLNFDFQNEKFDFVYLSNIISSKGYQVVSNDCDFTYFLDGKDILINNFKNNLKPDGLIYLTNYHSLNEFLTKKSLSQEKVYSSLFKYDKRLSNLAQIGENYSLGMWKPGIIRKNRKFKKQPLAEDNNLFDEEKTIDDDIFCLYQ